MEFSGDIKSNLSKRTTANQKIVEFIGSSTGANFDDSWMGRWPLEDITNYFNNLMLANEAGSNWANFKSSSSKENLGENFVRHFSRDGVIKTEAKINFNDHKGDVLRKGFR